MIVGSSARLPGGRVGSLLVLLVLAALPACGGSAPSDRAPTNRRGERIDFVFAATDGTFVTGTKTQGRATAVVFVTTYDLHSQVQVRQLNEVLRSTAPIANGVAVVLEPPRYAPLIDAYRDSIGLTYPVVLADHATLERRGPFGYVDKVPTTVVLDYQGREVWRYYGVSETSALAQALRAGARPELGGGGLAPPSSK